MLKFYSQSSCGLFTIITFCIIGLFTLELSGQNGPPLFTPRIDIVNNVLPSDALSRLASLTRGGKYISVTPITLGSLTSIQQDGDILMQLPGVNSSLVFSTDNMMLQTSGDFEWYGRIDEDPEAYAFLERRKGETFGALVYHGRSFLIQSLVPGYSLLLEEDMSHVPLEECSPLVLEERVKNVKPNQLEKNAQDCEPQTVVRILVLYSSAAQSTVGNISQYAATQIGALNNTVFNSDINFNDLRFESAGVRNFAGFSESASTNIGVEVQALQQAANEPGSFVNNLRNDQGADLVILLTNGTYNAAGGAFQQVGNAAQAYGVVEVDFPTSRNTFAHEVGHLLGARHDTDAGTTPPAGSGNIDIFAAGRQFFAGGADRWTTMAVGPTNDMRIPYFSNPNVDFEGVPTGIANFRDNARQVRDNGACIVSCYRPPFEPPMDVVITGFNVLAAGSSSQWCTSIANCDNVTDYNWEYSTNGFNYTNIFGGSCVSRTAPNNADQFYLRVTATCTDGQTADDIHYVRVSSGTGGGGPIPIVAPSGESEEEVSARSEFVNLVSAYPNPSFGDVTVKFNTLRATKVTAKMLSQDGRVLSVTRSMVSGAGVHSLNMKPVTQPGIYLIRLATDESSAVTKIIVR